MRFLKFFSIMLLTFVLCACAKMGYQSDEYIKQSQAVHPIVVPAGAIPPMQKPYYRVPSVSVQASKTPVSLVPPGSNVLQYREMIKSKKKLTTGKRG